MSHFIGISYNLKSLNPNDSNHLIQRDPKSYCYFENLNKAKHYLCFLIYDAVKFYIHI